MKDLNNNSLIKKDEIRDLIIKYKNEGYTFREVSDILNKEYGVKRSKQAVAGMYKRALKSELYLDYSNIKQLILHLRSLGYKITDIVNIVSQKGYNMSYSNIYYIIKKDTDLLEQIEKDNIIKIFNIIFNECILDRVYMSDVLGYDGYKPTNKALDRYIYRAFIYYLDKEVKYYKSKLGAVIQDKEIKDKLKLYKVQDMLDK